MSLVPMPQAPRGVAVPKPDALVWDEERTRQAWVWGHGHAADPENWNKPGEPNVQITTRCEVEAYMAPGGEGARVRGHAKMTTERVGVVFSIMLHFNDDEQYEMDILDNGPMLMKPNDGFELIFIEESRR